MSESSEVVDDLSLEATKALVELAGNPQAGDPFEFGGKQFRRQFLTVESERALYEQFTSALTTVPNASIAEAFLVSLNHLIDATAIVLTDQDPECDDVWVRQVRGAGLASQMVGIVLAQAQLQEMTPLLGKLSAVSVLAHVLAAKVSSPLPG